MNTDLIATLDRTGRPTAPAGPSSEREEIRRLAQEFEALLMTQMLREMRRSMLDEQEQEDGLGAGVMQDTGDVELGRALSQSGGLGLTDALLKAFEERLTSRDMRRDAGALTATGQATSPGAPALADPRTSVVTTVAANVAASAPISSGFGWRSDPLTGAARFHKGVDIAVAYGADVRAAAEGRVSFSGVQNGYGNTIVIDHHGGRQTRYAHLSDQTVRAGDRVAEGQVIGRSGNSGRTTGAHLHFELRVDGQPVDPSAE